MLVTAAHYPHDCGPVNNCAEKILTDHEDRHFQLSTGQNTSVFFGNSPGSICTHFKPYFLNDTIFYFSCQLPYPKVVKKEDLFIPMKYTALTMTLLSLILAAPLAATATVKSAIPGSVDRGNFGIFEDTGTEEEVFSWFYSEHGKFGTKKHVKAAQTIKYQNTVIMQRSGQKRLFDQNILLAALFEGRITHKKYGPMIKIFQGSVFIDIRSGILYGKRAPTVRDISEDARLLAKLSFIIANEIKGSHRRSIETKCINR